MLKHSGFLSLEVRIMEVIVTPEFNYLDGGVNNTFGNIMYIVSTAGQNDIVSLCVHLPLSH